jgi:hypothetical protein
MNRNKNFENLLNECLERLLKGESLEQVLGDYPAEAAELEPLLRTITAARKVSDIQPRADFKARSHYAFMAAARELESKPARRSWFKWQPAWSISLAALAVIVLGGGGTVLASNSSLPGDTLYSVKIVSENVQLALSTSDITKAELNARFADRRTDEIITLAEQNDAKNVVLAVSNLNNNLSNLNTLAGYTENHDAMVYGNDGQESFSSFNTATDKSAAGGVQAPAATTPDYSVTMGEASQTPESTPNTMAPQVTATVTPSANPMSGNDRSLRLDSAQAPNTPDIQIMAEGSRGDYELTKYEKLRIIIEENYRDRQARLEAALEQTVTPSVRQVLIDAMNDSEQQYLTAIRSLAESEQAEINQSGNLGR